MAVLNLRQDNQVERDLSPSRQALGLQLKSRSRLAGSLKSLVKELVSEGIISQPSDNQVVELLPASKKEAMKEVKVQGVSMVISIPERQSRSVKRLSIKEMKSVEQREESRERESSLKSCLKKPGVKSETKNVRFTADTKISDSSSESESSSESDSE